MARLPQGLLHALLLDGQGGARVLDEAGLARWAPEQGVLWVHLDYTHQGAGNWLGQQPHVPERVTEALLTLETRPRLTRIGDGLLAYLRGVNLQPGAQPEDMIAIRLWLTPSQIISTQRRTLVSVTDMCSALETGQGPASVGALVADLVDRLTWYMEDVIVRIEAQVSDAEELVRSAMGAQARQPLSDLRRQCTVLRRYMAPQRDAISALMQDASGLLSEDDRAVIREAADRLLRLLEDLDSAREHASIAMEELTTALSDRLNRRLYVLAVITAMFLPLSFLTGMFGVNLAGMPGATDPHAFAVFGAGLLGLMIAIGLYLKRNRWL